MDKSLVYHQADSCELLLSLRGASCGVVASDGCVRGRVVCVIGVVFVACVYCLFAVAGFCADQNVDVVLLCPFLEDLSFGDSVDSL